MTIRNLKNSLSNFFGVFGAERLPANCDAQEDLDYDEEEDALLAGQYRCTISVLQHEGLIHEVDVDFYETISSASFADLVCTLSDRYSNEFTWSVTAVDWTGAAHNHRHQLTVESIDTQHYELEAQQMQRCGC